MEQNVNQPQVGMSMKNPSLLKEGEFPLAVNGILQSVNGNFAMISNDHSNILATKFKDGFKVIGVNYVPSISTTFFFLVNPVTGESEIGFIYDSSNQDKPDASSPCATCNYQIVEDTPLEQTIQSPVSTYYTFVNANCLNFDIDHPVTSWIKIDDCNIRMYFNDFKNPPRYIDYKDFQKINLSNCPVIQTDQLDCDKILIFPETCYPIVEVVDVVSGGQNTAGIYQFAVCYSDVRSNKVTDYFYVSNPTPLYDQAIIPNANTAYPIAKSFKLQITNLNTDFKYFNLAVLKTINNVTSVFLVETFDIKSSLFEYVYTGVDRNLQADLSIDEIIGKRPHYNKAKITTESNGYLFMANLEEDRVLNLQPVVSQIPLRWQTVEMNDGDYANPIIAQNYVGYLGDEVYPFGIAFTKVNGTQTNVFPFVGRAATPHDIEDVSFLPNTSCPDTAGPSGTITYTVPNNDIIQSSSCSPTRKNLRWQVYNTASLLGDSEVCIPPASGAVTTVQITDIRDCDTPQILMDSIDTYNSITGNITYTATPLFWHYPSTDPSSVHYIGTDPNTLAPYNYPPQTASDIVGLQAYLADSANIITSSPSAISALACDCASFLNDYPAGATASDLPVVIDPEATNTSVNIITSEQIVTQNTYVNGSGQVIPLPFQVAGLYPTEPQPWNPLTNSSGTFFFEQWYNERQNTNPADAAFITQSNTASSQNLDVWGGFTFNSNNPNMPCLQDNWYSFVCGNSSGVAAVRLSVSPNQLVQLTTGNISFDVFSDPTATPLVPLTPVPNITPNPAYKFYQNLTVGGIYYIRVTGCKDILDLNIPGTSPADYGFNLSVISPIPITSETFIVPGAVTVTKQCQITYQGIPQNTCEPQAYEYGEFAYWESGETYPCNEEVWADLAGKPIRHFKFPDHKISSFFREVGSYANALSSRKNLIYPKGVLLNVNDIKFALTNAVSLGLISEEEKSQICGYRVYRGNRRGNQSIIAKGLLYDVWQYRDNIYNSGNQVLFPNFPFNDNRSNQFIKRRKVTNSRIAEDPGLDLQHPFLGLQNNKYTFDAPNLSFNNPGLGSELKLECEQIGVAIGNYNVLRNNTQYQYIGPGIISAAIGFASLEAAFEGINSLNQATLTTFGVPVTYILALVYENIAGPVKMFQYYGQWYEIIKKFAPFRNYATTYSGVGKYINHDEVCFGNTRRTIVNTQYIKPGILNVKTQRGDTRFNNFKRDSSVFIELGENPASFFTSTNNQDTSRVLPSCNSIGVRGNVASYYGSMKNELVNQYGQIDNIEWIDTGYNGRIEWNNPEQTTLCDTIFGGDTYINRFTKKRKVPMFMEDRVIPSSVSQVSPINQDIQLSLLPNIGYPTYFMDYPNTLDYTGGLQSLFGDVAVYSRTRADYHFYCFSSSGQSWKDAGLGAAIVGGTAAGISLIPSITGATIAISVVTKRDLGNDLFLNGKYVHSFYGITSFLCESDYNLDYRHGENIKEKNFYPNVGDTNEWTQEFFVPMYEDNYFLYNTDYSKQNTFNPNFVLNNDYNQSKELCKSQHPNRLIYSLQDNDQNEQFDGNLIFLANNYYEFPKSGGKLLIVRGLENGKVLVVQENRASVFNSYITLQTNVATATVGSNTLFNQQAPAQFMQTDLGFGGSQTPAIVSTEFGHYWVDNKRGQVLVKTEGIQNIVKPEEEWWFKENLPFKILKDFPEFDITNNFKYIGMAITYDARYKRIFFTKRDVELRPEYKGVVQYNGQFFTYKDDKFDITSSKYFCNKSWTLSYNPLFKNFVSFHTFTPNYYTLEQAYFSSGVNYSFDDPSEEGLWHHNLTNKSYQVYYGKLKPFIFEFSIGSKYANKVLEGVEYISEFYRFQDNLSSYLVQDKTYNKALVYNQNQTSGLLELVPKQKNNRMQFIQYPKQKPESREILVENIENLWRFNNFFNVAQLNGQPILTFDCDNIAYRSPNPLAIKYNSQYLKDLMRSDYHVIRLINDKYSNYNILQRFSITKTNNSIS